MTPNKLGIDQQRPYKLLSVNIEYASPVGSSSSIYMSLFNNNENATMTTRHHNVTQFARKLTIRAPKNVPFTTSTANSILGEIAVTGSTVNTTVLITGVARVAYKQVINQAPLVLSQDVEPLHESISSLKNYSKIFELTENISIK